MLAQSKATIQNLSVSADCKLMCFPPKLSATWQGPYAREKGTVAPGACPGTGIDETSKVARPWLNSSFWNLRVKGAQGTEACPLSKGHGLCTFLVSGSISASGVVGALSVQSESGGNFTFLSPWAASVTPTATCDTGPGCSGGGGKQVRVNDWTPAGLFHLEPHERVLAFETSANTTYTVAIAGGG